MLQVLAKDCYPEVSCSPARPLGGRRSSVPARPPARPGGDARLPRGALSLSPRDPILHRFQAGGPRWLRFP